MVREAVTAGYTTARNILIGVVGTTVVLVGVALIVLPGPAIVVIPAGLGILAVEFTWARRWLEHARDHSSRAIDALRRPGAQRAEK